MDCLSDDQICELLEGRASGDQRARVEEHLDGCAACRRLVAAATPDRISGPVAPVAAALARGASVDRYMIVDVLGAGGMGIVYLAYDPELDRKVALKVVRPDGGDRAGQSARILREAQAMARLSHPNVMAVHDVGPFGDGVFIVLEFVDGVTLSRWLREAPRAWSEVLPIFLQAGRGLAAAHAAGIVHRDFKPDNVMLDRQGRARVGDFGLARSAEHVPTGGGSGSGAQEQTSLAGTPAYMAPEQRRGEPVDPRADIYSFCVALHESLHGERPTRGLPEAPAGRRVPAWLRAAVQRGLAESPAERPASMAVLLAALDAAPRRRRRALLSGALAAATLAGATFVARGSAEERLCAGAGDELAGVWDDEQRGRLRGALEASAAPWAADTWTAVEATLDRYAGAWTAMRREACVAARVTRTQSDAIFDLRSGCLEERRSGLRQLVRLLGEGDRAALEHAVRAVASLRPLETCADLSWLTSRVPPPDDPGTRREVEAARQSLAEVAALRLAGRYDAGVRQAGEVVDAARRLEYPPLVAEALREQALLLGRTAGAAAAASAMSEALLAAEAGSDRRLAAAALAELVWLRGHELGHHEEGLERARHAEAILAGLGGDDEIAAAIADNRGSVLGALGRYDEALASMREALRLRRAAHGEEHFQVAVTLNNLAVTLNWMGRDEEALPLQLEALAMYGRLVGTHHPQYAHTRMNLASALMKVGRHEEAQEYAERAHAGLLAAFGPDHEKVGAAENMLGLIALSRDRPGEAMPRFVRAREIGVRTRGPEHLVVAHYTSSLGEAQALSGRHQEAIASLEEAIARYEKVGDLVQAARVRRTLGFSQLALGLHAEAIAQLEQVLVAQTAGEANPLVLAETRFGLAQALAAAGREPARARELVDAAIAAAEVLGPRGETLVAKARPWRAALTPGSGPVAPPGSTRASGGRAP